MADKDYIDPHGYWACPEGGIRRIGQEDSEQELIIQKTDACSDAEWNLVCDALKSARSGARAERVMPQFHVEHNRVVIC